MQVGIPPPEYSRSRSLFCRRNPENTPRIGCKKGRTLPRGSAGRQMNKFPRQIGVGGLVISDYERKLVNQVLDSSRLTYGPMTKRFEEGFSRSHGCQFGLFMNSGTSALHV